MTTDTVAVEIVDPDVKTCENPACTVEFRRPPNRSRAHWVTRRYCTRACSTAMAHDRKRAPKTAEPLGASVTPAGQLWRPPGWAPIPNIGRSSATRPGALRSGA